MQRTKNPPMGFEKFCRETWPDRFTIPFTREEIGDVASVRDLNVAARAVMVGGSHAIVLESGKGKTTLACALLIWIACEGLRRYPVLACGDDGAAMSMRSLVETMVTSVRQRRRLAQLGLYATISIGGIRDDLGVPGVRDKVERPDFVIIDDPIQDTADESKIASIIETLTAIVPAMSGPGKRTSALFLGDLGICRRLQAKGWA